MIDKDCYCVDNRCKYLSKNKYKYVYEDLIQIKDMFVLLCVISQVELF